ncbi:phosphotransferase enzyme family protein [Paenibacillus sp. JCM 10914]
MTMIFMQMAGDKMMDLFRFETETQRHDLLSRAKRIASSALDRYDLEWQHIEFIGLSDTVTYQIKTSSGKMYLLRIHSDQRSKEEIDSELQFLDFLVTKGLHVPRGITARDGSQVQQTDTEEGFQAPYVTLMSWMDGEHAKGRITEDQAYHIGEMIGKLHEAASGFREPPDFRRPTWDENSYKIALNKLEKNAGTFLSDQAWAMYQQASDKVIAKLATIQENEVSFGLIHADLHLGNIVFQDDCPYPIDFDRCGYGYYLYDLVAVMMGLNPNLRLKVMEGYERVLQLDDNHVQYLEDFFIMTLMENYSHHSSNPNETEGLKAEQIYALAYIQEYLEGRSFLLDKITPLDEKNDLMIS